MAAAMALIRRPIGVLIDQCGRRGVMAHSNHQVTGAGAGLRCQRVACVPQIMQIKFGDAQLIADLPPRHSLCQVAPKERLPVLIGKIRPSSPGRRTAQDGAPTQA
jgi:hypothetical protein